MILIFTAMKENVYETPQMVELLLTTEQAVLAASLPDIEDGGEL